MNLNATSSGKKHDLRNACKRLVLTAQTEDEWRLLAAIYRAFVRGGTMQVRPVDGEGVNWEMGDKAVDAPKPTPFKVVAEFGGNE